MALGAQRVLCANNKIEMGSVFVHGEEAFQQGNSTGAATNNLISQTKKLNRVLARDSYIIRRSKKRSHPFFSAFYPIRPASSFDKSGGGDSAASEKRQRHRIGGKKSSRSVGRARRAILYPKIRTQC